MSFNEMLAFLKYFGYNVYEMIEIPINDSNLILTFESPYNYNPSSINITLNTTEPANNTDINKIASAGKETLPAAGNPLIVVLLALLAIGVGGLKRRL